MIRCLDRCPTFYDAVLRSVAAGLLVVPGASKLVTYGDSVAFFASLGVPAAAVTAPVVGVLELLAAAALFLDRYAVAAGLAVVPVMVVAAVTAGPSLQNVAVGVIGLSLPVLRWLGDV